MTTTIWIVQTTNFDQPEADEVTVWRTRDQAITAVEVGMGPDLGYMKRTDGAEGPGSVCWEDAYITISVASADLD